jgi:mannan endo-1,4-beta-mannosidase
VRGEQSCLDVGLDSLRSGHLSTGDSLSKRSVADLTQGKRARRHWEVRGLRGSTTRRPRVAAVIGTAGAAVLIIAAAAAVVAAATRAVPGVRGSGEVASHAQPSKRNGFPTAHNFYFGVYTPGVPVSYKGVSSFTAATGVRPDLAVYYSGWFEPFWTSFARAAARHGALPLVQLNPRGVTTAAIASGQYDDYLISYAKAVRIYGGPVVLSFGHEMNGDWYPWGYRHTSPTIFVAAWRRIVKIFRVVGARNVIWMWTVNSVYTKHDMIPDPAAWWPGRSYVNWAGIDGYFHEASAQFASVFGPTIIDVRELTNDPILISETGAGPNTGQAAKIASLFVGVRSYDLLGFVWFDAVGNADYRIVSRASIAALRLGAKTNGLS